MATLVGLLLVTWIILSPSNLSTWFKPIATPPLELLKSSPKSYDLDNLGRHFGDAAKSDFWNLGPHATSDPAAGTRTSEVATARVRP